MIRILAVSAFLALAVSASAISVDGSPYGSIAVEVSRDPQNANSVWVRTVSRSGTPRASGGVHDVRLRILRTSEGATVTVASFNGQGTYSEGNLVASYSVSGTAYLWFNVWNYNDGVASPAVIGPVTIDAAGNVGEPPPLTYLVSFNIPPNLSDRLVRYEVRQGGETVGSYTATPGSAGGPQTFPGISGTAPVDLYEVHPTLTQKPDGSFEFSSSGPGAYERKVASGATPTPSTGGTPPAAAVTPVDKPSTDGAAPAPTGGGTNTANAPVWRPKVEVSGGTPGGQSTSDFTISAYREGTDKLYDSGKQNTAAVVSAIQQAAASQSTRDGITNDKLTTINASVTGLGGKLDTLNTTAGQIKSSTDSVKTAVDAVKSAIDSQKATAVKLVDNPGQYDANWRSSQMTAAQSAAGGVTYSGAKVTGDSVSVSGDSFTASTLGSVNVAGADVNFSLNPADMGAAASGFSIFTACRGLLLLAACVGFIYACSDTVNVYVASLGNAGGGGQALAGIENAVPGVTQAKHLASASAVSLAVMAAAAAIVAFVDTVAGRYGVGLSSMLNAMDLGPIGPAYGFLDQFFPVAAITALAILRAAFPYFVAPVYLGAASVARFLHI